MSFIEQTPGDVKREERKKALQEQGVKDQETAVSVVAMLVDAFETQREHVDELFTEAFINRKSPTDVVVGILKSTLTKGAEPC